MVAEPLLNFLNGLIMPIVRLQRKKIIEITQQSSSIFGTGGIGDVLLNPTPVLRPYGGYPIRHLMYYLCPIGDWRPVVHQMLDRIGQFNGKKILFIGYTDLCQIAHVLSVVGKHFDEVLLGANIKELREVIGWLPCLERLVSNDPRSIIFTAHAKGITHKDNTVIQKWTREMYEICLDYPKAIESSLERFAMCGAFRRVGQFPDKPNTVSCLEAPRIWHYSGSFYWMRACRLFERDWRNVDFAWYGSESYPGKIFQQNECECFVGDMCSDLYRQATWDTLLPKIEKWKQSQR